MKIREGIIDEAGRVYQLAFNAGFNKGRKSGYVVAACLYAACRLQKTTHMLIDFSDMMQVRLAPRPSACVDSTDRRSPSSPIRTSPRRSTSSS